MVTDNFEEKIKEIAKDIDYDDYEDETDYISKVCSFCTNEDLEQIGLSYNSKNCSIMFECLNCGKIWEVLYIFDSVKHIQGGSLNKHCK